jgi:hypothetical protein
MKWVELPLSYSGERIFGLVDDDGLMKVTCSEENDEYLAWVAEGNEAEEWNPE